MLNLQVIASGKSTATPGLTQHSISDESYRRNCLLYMISYEKSFITYNGKGGVKVQALNENEKGVPVLISIYISIYTHTHTHINPNISQIN